MEATVAKLAPPEPEQGHDGEAEATRSTEELFQWSTHVHVGDGAQECEHGEDGQCSEHRHFHCWLCLPNTFQARDIQDKARAAKARKRRSLQDPESDAHVVLEEQIEAWGLTDQTFTALCGMIADRAVQQQYGEIADDLQSSERFEHYATDIEEFQRMAALPEPDRDSDDWKRLEEDTKVYRDEFEKRAKARNERELSILRSEGREKVLDRERQFQIDQISTEMFLHVYYTWAYYTCARVPSQDTYPTQRIFDKPEALRDAAPEVIQALRDAYRSLEGRMIVRGDAAGN